MNRENYVWIGLWATTKMEIQNQLTKVFVKRLLCRKSQETLQNSTERHK